MACQCCVSLAWLGFLLTNYSPDCLQQSLSGSQGLSQDLTGKCLPLENGVNISRIYIYNHWFYSPKLYWWSQGNIYFWNILKIFVITLEIFLSCRCPVRCKLSSSGEITQDLDIFRSHNKMLSIICLLSSRNGRNGKYPNNCRFCHISGHFQARVEFKLWETFAECWAGDNGSVSVSPIFVCSSRLNSIICKPCPRYPVLMMR